MQRTPPRVAAWLLAAAVLCLLPSASSADPSAATETIEATEPAPRETVLRTITPEQVVAVLKAEGHADAQAHTPQRRQDPAVTFSLEGHPVSILMDTHGHWIQSYSAWSTPRVDAQVTNEWNRTQRFSRAYFDKQNRAVFETDLDLSGGVTLARVHDWVQTHDHRHRAFVAFLHEHALDGANTQPSTAPADG
ncbi:MAG: YbjN domain-containing protein [Planctomycetota bacterium]